jgi:hypothetical protein
LRNYAHGGLRFRRSHEKREFGLWVPRRRLRRASFLVTVVVRCAEPGWLHTLEPQRSSGRANMADLMSSDGGGFVAGSLIAVITLVAVFVVPRALATGTIRGLPAYPHSWISGVVFLDADSSGACAVWFAPWLQLRRDCRRIELQQSCTAGLLRGLP